MITASGMTLTIIALLLWQFGNWRKNDKLQWTIVTIGFIGLMLLWLAVCTIAIRYMP